MADAHVPGPLGYDVPLPPDTVAPEALLAQGQREQIAVSQGQLAQLSNISHLLGRQSAQTSLFKFDGDPKRFQDWIRSLEKYVLLIGTKNDDSIKGVALQSAEGPVSDFLVRCYKNDSRCTWEDILKELKARFGEIVDSQHGLQVLRTTRQKATETVQVYAERLLCVAEQAWPDQPLNQTLIQQQLIDVFIDGLQDNMIARKVLRQAPPVLEQAVQLAVAEQNLAKKFSLRNRGFVSTTATTKAQRSRHENISQHEPMEVDSFLGRCYTCRKKGHRATDCRRRSVQSVQLGLVCYKCGQAGHGLATCRNPGRPETGRCWQCGALGHKRIDCPNKNKENDKAKRHEQGN